MAGQPLSGSKLAVLCLIIRSVLLRVHSWAKERANRFLCRPKNRLLKANVAVQPTEVAPDLSVSEN
jgi:hypothetical protein